MLSFRELGRMFDIDYASISVSFKGFDKKNELVAKCDRFKTLKHSLVNPYAFTEQGIFYTALLNSLKKAKNEQ